MTTIILIADHDRGLAQALDRSLRTRGFEVATAHNALECIYELRDNCPDVLIIDPCILWGGGAGVLQLLNDEEPVKRPTVIYLESPGNPSVPEHLQSRIDERIQRPQCLSELMPCVESLVDLIRSHIPAASIPEAVDTAKGTAPTSFAVDRQYLNQ